ncbi:MAG: hypothetical protein CMM44_11115 [Rhodospirillaceae bacterium]|nr:hypothetical protein [Rhodospirillaceae bacterium]
MGGENNPTVAILMWVGVFLLLWLAWRKHDGTLKKGTSVGWGYFLMMTPRLCCALTIAVFAAELLPGETISKWLGSESGFQGIIIASFAGLLIPAGGVIAFPMALAMYKIGVGIPQLVAFLTTWEIFAIHRILAWEIPFLGYRFVTLRIASSFFLPPLAGVFAALIVFYLDDWMS